MIPLVSVIAIMVTIVAVVPVVSIAIPIMPFVSVVVIVAAIYFVTIITVVAIIIAIAVSHVNAVIIISVIMPRSGKGDARRNDDARRLVSLGQQKTCSDRAKSKTNIPAITTIRARRKRHREQSGAQYESQGACGQSLR